MSGIDVLLRERIAAGEERLRQALRGFLTGGLLRDYLPQTWIVITERETLSVHADVEGNITVTPGDTMVRDGAIAIQHDVLEESLRTGKTPPPNGLVLTFYTKKGEAAFKQLAKYFGM